MSKSRSSVRHFRYLLKQTSKGFRRIVSSPIPDFSVHTQCSSNVDESEHEPFARIWSNEPPSIEFRLTEELIQAMQSIVLLRQSISRSLGIIPFGDPRQGRIVVFMCSLLDQKDAFLKKIQDVETRALIFLTLPPSNIDGLSEDQVLNEVNSVFNLFVIEAKSCFSAVDKFLRGECATDESISLRQIFKPSERSDLPTELHIAGFCQYDAQILNKKIDNSLFRIITDPDLRSYTVLVKVIIGSACSQITCGDPEHCLNRLNYLMTFFEGSPVRAPGSATAEVFCLPPILGTEFAWHCLLNAALAQAERQFTFSLDSALPFAAVLATLLARYPEQVPNFLARISLACPVLTLYTDEPEAVFHSLSDETAALNDDVSKSWRGICRLFAAVLVARLPPGFSQRPKHLNPKLLWITVVGVARKTKYLELTTEVLHGLLEVGGWVLLQFYGRQARRLFKSILKSIEDSVSTEQLALSTFLELLLYPTTAVENGYGVLLDAFWN